MDGITSPEITQAHDLGYATRKRPFSSILSVVHTTLRYLPTLERTWSVFSVTSPIP